MIEHYQFGFLIYKGKSYNKDLIILKDLKEEKVLPNWWRKEGHYLCVEDLAEVFSFKPIYLIVGTGASGVMKIDPQVKIKCQNLGIILESHPRKSC